MFHSRSVLNAAVALCALLATAAFALTGSYNEKREQLRLQAEAAAKKLGLEDRAKLFDQYPTPEVSLGGTATEPQRVSCGQTFTADLQGKFAKGTAFLISDDDVRVLDEKRTAGGWHAKLQVGKGAFPADVTVTAFAPVSNAQQSTRVAVVRGRYELDLDFEDGWKAQLRPAADADDSGDNFFSTATFTKGPETRSLRADVRPGGEGVRVDLEMSAEEQALSKQTMTGLQANFDNSGFKAMQEKIGACTKLPQDSQLGCIQAMQPEMEKMAAESKARSDALEAEVKSKRVKASWNCQRLQLTARAGALTGTAECQDEVRFKVTGTVRCLPLKPKAAD